MTPVIVCFPLSLCKGSKINQHTRILSIHSSLIDGCNMPKVKCDICGYTKLKSHKGLVMHQASNDYCLLVQHERRNAEEHKEDPKPGAIAKNTNVAKREQHLDVEGEGPPCKKERLLEEVLMQKMAMMEPPKREGVQNIREENSEENHELLEGISMGGLPYSVKGVFRCNDDKE